MENDLQKKFKDFIRECRFTRRLRPATVRGYENHMKVFFELMPQVTKPEHLTLEVATLFFEKLQTRKRIVGRDTVKVGIKPSTIRAYWSRMSSFFEWLRLKEFIDENPLPRDKCPRPEYVDKKALSKSDIEKIITAINLKSKNNFLFKRDLVIVYLLLLCGIRKGELLSLRVLDVDLNKETLTVVGETSKSKKTRYIPLNHTLVLLLEDYLKERNFCKSEYLLISNNSHNKLTEHGIKHWVNRIRKNSGVRFHLHQFRHTFACNLGNNNTNAIKVQKLLGHVDLRMTQKYLRSMDVDDLRSDINKLTLDNLI